MEIRIGIQHSPREIVIESEEEPSALVQRVSQAVESGAPLTFEDSKGRVVVVPGAKLAYAEVSTDEPRRVGFFG